MNSDKEFGKGSLQSLLKRSFFSSSNKNDFPISAVFALLTVALSLGTCFQYIYGVNSISWALLFLIQFPLNLLPILIVYQTLIGIFSSHFGIIGWLIGAFLLNIPSFVFRVIVFYSLARFTKKILGQKDTFFLHHLPSLLICIIFTIFFVFYIWPACQWHHFRYPY
jgi:hypothetical protein